MAASLWAKTYCPGARVKLYIDPRIEDAWAETDWRHGTCSILLHPATIRAKRFGAILVHEFVHVVEYLNDPEYLSVKATDNCTPLAQALEKQLFPLMANLRLTKGDSALNPFFSLRR